MSIRRKPKSRTVRLIKVRRTSYRLRLRRSMLNLRAAMRQEREETKQMMQIYRRHAKGLASKEELEFANNQFFDLLRGLGLGIFAVLPFAPITIPLIVKLGRWVGVEVMPSSFAPQKQPKKPTEPEQNR
ncbi:hypothetical protein DS2_06101 [Catenovulum agarivorans DS-2]|uniref:Letm1 RBD domain-containing protein n=1 Tax=Catenovulum agarivorans DS-2 TaxID=1328313 RepID=W7QZP7_9ALTE|nr:hypothetical protein [Catenovulum agarivorans]EWH10840.1 hypothetical protein DS2_06101 [Catenovulum agarivorans DS-2]